MKKFLTVVLTLLASKAAFALPIGNPASPNFFEKDLCCEMGCGFFPVTERFLQGPLLDKFKFQVGYRGNFVNDRYFEKEHGAGHLYYFQVNTNAGYAGINFCDLVDVYATYGATKIEFAGNNRTFGPDDFGSQSIIYTRSSPSWSVGARAILFEWKCLTLGAQGEYFRSRLDLNRVFFLSDSSSTYIDGETSLYKEWQASLGLAYQYHMHCLPISLYPYAALSVSNALLDSNDLSVTNAIETVTINLVNFQSSQRWGYAVGVSFVFCDSFALTAEGRWANEEAFSIIGSMRF